MTSRSDMKRIEDVKQAVEADLLNRPGVNGVDIGFKYVNGQKTDQIAIRVLVDEKHDVPPEEAIPREINGVVTDVIEEKIVLHTVSLPLDAIQLMADSTRYDPLRGGISIGPVRVIDNSVFVGTAGLVVRDNATNAAILLSNFHVMAVDNGSNVGDEMVQPGRPDGGHTPSDLVGTLQRHSLSGQVDAAVASISGRQGVCEIQDIGRVAGTAGAVLNAPVRKRGRTAPAQPVNFGLMILARKYIVALRRETNVLTLTEEDKSNGR